jgi:hypothetical protein
MSYANRVSTLTVFFLAASCLAGMFSCTACLSGSDDNLDVPNICSIAKLQSDFKLPLGTVLFVTGVNKSSTGSGENFGRPGTLAGFVKVESSGMCAYTVSVDSSQAYEEVILSNSKYNATVTRFRTHKKAVPTAMEVLRDRSPLTQFSVLSIDRVSETEFLNVASRFLYMDYPKQVGRICELYRLQADRGDLNPFTESLPNDLVRIKWTGINGIFVDSPNLSEIAFDVRPSDSLISQINVRNGDLSYRMSVISFVDLHGAQMPAELVVDSEHSPTKSKQRFELKIDSISSIDSTSEYYLKGYDLPEPDLSRIERSNFKVWAYAAGAVLAALVLLWFRFHFLYEKGI